MVEKSLLERLQIQATEGSPNKNKRGDFERVVASVTNHLRKILNTRQGTVRIDPDFGIPDFTLLSGGISVIEAEHIEATILKVIQKHEPRLKDCKVRFNGSSLNDLLLKFQLEGTLILDQQSFIVQFKSQMSATSKFEVDYCDI
jgi:type VI secretion system protein